MHHYENWHRALDVQMDLHKWSLTPFGARYHTAFFWSILTNKGALERKSDADEQLTAHLTATLFRADTIYVTQDMQHVLLQAAHDLPDDVMFDDHMLITPMGFCMFEEPMYGMDTQGAQIAVHAIAWELLQDRVTIEGEEQPVILIYFFTDPLDEKDEWNAIQVDFHKKYDYPLPPLSLNHFYVAKVGETIPAEDEREASKIVVAIVKLFVAMQYLAQQTIGEPMKMRPNRAVRKRAISWDRDQERYITLITLRRKSVKKDDHEPQKIEWSHRWVVKGHWRRQYYPKTKTHGWKYIYEYVKGPEDKPLLIRERRVFNFRR